MSTPLQIIRDRKASLCSVGLGLLAGTAGGVLPALAQPGVSSVFCTFTSSSATSIAEQDGFANALENIAESICDAAAGGTSVTSIDSSISAVASAMAQAVASVVGQCSGVGNAQVVVNAVAMAEAEAVAVGRASAEVLATSEVCGLCESALEALVESVGTVAATAVAAVTVDDSFVFAGNTITVSNVEEVVEENILELMASITGEVRADAMDGCSIDVEPIVIVGSRFAECDVSISADDIITEIDAVAEAGLAVQALACEGGLATVDVNIIVEETAVAVAQAIVSADAFCESDDPSAMACALTRGSARAIASTQATVFVNAMAEALAPDCDCDLTATLMATEVQDIFAMAAGMAFTQVCLDGPGYVIDYDLDAPIEEMLVNLLGQAIAMATAGPECTVSVGAGIEFSPEE